ncbi:MAG: hypothetical protein JST00_29785 [Deltaproteobacteria bacterium]|nr:hypothetical protein [Deltaproteobacteria bacterium]
MISHASTSPRGLRVRGSIGLAGALVLFACTGEDPVLPTTSDAGSSGSSGTVAGPKTIACKGGTIACNAATGEACCGETDANGACQTAASCADNKGRFECDSADDCKAGERCCAIVVSPAPEVLSSSCVAAAACPGNPSYQLCNRANECPAAGDICDAFTATFKAKGYLHCRQP